MLNKFGVMAGCQWSLRVLLSPEPGTDVLMGCCICFTACDRDSMHIVE